MTKKGITTPYARELRDLVVKLSETHTMGAIVALIKGKKSFTTYDRKRFNASAGYNMVSTARRKSGNGEAEAQATPAPTNGNGKGRSKRKKAFDCKLFLPGGVVMELQPGQYYEVRGKTLIIKEAG